LRGSRDFATEVSVRLPHNHARRVVYDAGHSQIKPDISIADPFKVHPENIAINNAYNGATAFYRMLEDVFHRRSIDGQDAILNLIIHYGTNFMNALWDGRQVIFGDGDKQVFGDFTRAWDIIGHELGHGVEQFEANPKYWKQSGAINEHYADVFGSLSVQYYDYETADDANWIIGWGLLMPGIDGIGIRKMDAPGTAYDDPELGCDPQPSHYRDYVETNEDNGGVHINNGILNLAYVKTCKGVGGYAWKSGGQIWYNALCHYLNKNSDFVELATSTIDSARDLFGSGSIEELSTKRAWQDVGVI
jgi:Zn-dependent metalloprotease